MNNYENGIPNDWGKQPFTPCDIPDDNGSYHCPYADTYMGFEDEMCRVCCGLGGGRMKRKDIKAKIAEYGYTMIKPSWYQSKDGDAAIFNAFDDCGVCHCFYVSGEFKKARRQMLSDASIFEATDVAFMFWE